MRILPMVHSGPQIMGDAAAEISNLDQDASHSPVDITPNKVGFAGQSVAWSSSEVASPGPATPHNVPN
ncbi:uncharacterized protein J3R85_020970 [Psidium guajava]|nr:uncharacterized protein J3R85_020970 [Psidium guajava]